MPHTYISIYTYKYKYISKQNFHKTKYPSYLHYTDFTYYLTIFIKKIWLQPTKLVLYFTKRYYPIYLITVLDYMNHLRRQNILNSKLEKKISDES